MEEISDKAFPRWSASFSRQWPLGATSFRYTVFSDAGGNRTSRACNIWFRFDFLPNKTDGLGKNFKCSKNVRRQLKTNSSAVTQVFMLSDDRSANKSLPTREFPFPLGKGASLQWLATRIRSAEVPEFLKFSVAHWNSHKQDILKICHQNFGSYRIAVRSDAHLEDQKQETRAGEFCTLLHVAPENLAQSINQVAQSMPSHPGNAVLIQRMVSKPQFVGVASTHRISDGAPWYCIELAHHDVAAVTGGRATGRQVAVARHAASDMQLVQASERLALRLIQEVEHLAENHPLEIEFALSGQECTPLQGHLLQMRPLTTTRHWPVAHSKAPPLLPDLDFLREADGLTDIAGNRTILTLMSDWNPAELIGAHPRPLALSLFNELIAKGVWWHARAQLGYAPPPQKDVALLRILQGRPFVDVRRSANSLLPALLPSSTRRELVNGWMEQLSAAPALHDKVEFLVFRTVRDFASPSVLSDTKTAGLSLPAHAQWEAALGDLTAKLMGTGSASPLNSWNAVISGLEQDELQGQDWTAIIQRCKQGTTAFAAIARIAFAAEAQLRSAIQRGALTPERALALRAAARSSPIHSAATSVTFSHLRPGTFDITQPVWSSDRYRHAETRSALSPAEPFSLAPQEVRALEQLSKDVRLPLDASEWVRFVQQSASSREWSKFVFSRHLSAVLEGIASEVKAMDLEREHASWLTLDQVHQGRASAPADRQAYWIRCAEQAQSTHKNEARVVTGPVLREPQDRYVADSLGALPNFIGSLPAQGRLVNLGDGRTQPAQPLRGTIVLLSKADPGFDWLFDHGIVGLITEWGGANSHMAIRCAEFGLSAAIGCGPSVYARACAARTATIDPTTESVWFE